MEKNSKDRIAFANTLLFETPGGLRYTQDSPILPNVWLAYAAEPHIQHELILTTTQNGGTGQAAYRLRKMLNALRKKRDTKNKRERPRISYIPGQIAVKLYFDELMRVVLPLTPWWHQTYDCLRKLEENDRLARMEQDHHDSAQCADWKPFPQPGKDRENDLVDALMVMRQDIFPDVSPEGEDDELTDRPEKMASGLDKTEERVAYIRAIPPDLSWLVRIAGLIGDCFKDKKDKKRFLARKNDLSSRLLREFSWRQRLLDDPDLITTTTPDGRIKALTDQDYVSRNDAISTRRGIVQSFLNIFEAWSDGNNYPDERLIWRITKNRPVKLAVNKSSLTVKADAAIRLFDISCENITWAILDSGIDRNHPAFKLVSPEAENRARRRIQKENGKNSKTLKLSHLTESRVTKTLDFTRLRELLDFEIEEQEQDRITKEKKERVKLEIARRLERDETQDPEKEKARLAFKAEEMLESMRNRIKEGKDINWQDLEDAIVDHNPEVPSNDHGTHVAGILGADWIEDYKQESILPLSQRTRRMQGVCPDINLIDVRVFREDGLTDEFELLAAIQYLRWMNSRAGTMAVHGANLSLSLIHEVRRFACGQTPICEECNESAALGMVIVAAAGNRGFDMQAVDEITSKDSYKSVSITDPGNADGVITVGATHRKRPHEYGVSYFSSRGPTGDGRLKPDLVAPGEKIKGPTPNGRAEFKDGTSMAAPHVSGAAALLMARHSELIGQPERIKTILCNTATDLQRERYFQGNGLVDILRALQSV
ncbi:MAG: S8 family serine peptidase [Pseudomonadota bacterium]